ncbi:T9SS-dependent M36 family metallopeptidase [Chryseobacterium sp. LC2016-27]|uniref:T9SS-dependent M36 family metallopeptidase n=1 Tax=Chryseobacterium sp. LC2016-27 TaxID=2897326 RepID=UPI001E400654|nr:T9SS-dependent M36 family metallopeptidase [Chryseobacterium sp. LC2016-27]MCD0456530.1 T9SS-dependent M36 family metallopeptidase [Chryseobacterium sp. LC2016-27]
MKKVILPLVIAVFAVIPSVSFAQSNEVLIKNYISQNKLREYKKSDLNQFIIDNVDSSKSLNGDVVKIQQTYNGLPVYNSVATALVKDSKVVYFTDNFIKDYHESTSTNATISKNSALDKIADDLGNSEISSLPIIKFLEKTANKNYAAKQRLVYANNKNGDLRLAYEYSFSEPKSANYWSIIVDANNGDIISKANLTTFCEFEQNTYSHDYSQSHIHADDSEHSFVGAENKIDQLNQNLALLLPDNASYNIFPLPLEAPTFGPRSILSNPWDLTASPEGWHSDGTTHYTVTRGNNVFAYEDVAGTALTVPPDYLPGAPADGGASRNFNFPFSMTGSPTANLNASITNLFYLNNKIHDVFYQFGFTESARNFQQNNFGKGGLEDDSVFAEAQDGGGTNNANFSSPEDSYNPRMQMYLWSSINRIFFYNAPTAATTRTPSAGTAAFGPMLTATGVTGDIQLSSVLNGCTALPAGSLTGKIGLVERGTCDFALKTKNLQNAGAIATIVYNNAANGNTIGGMAGTDATITIPAVLVGNTEGEYIKTHLSANTVVNITLKNDPALSVTPDGSFDNGIVTHEYGHGISNRMTGIGYNCLNSNLSNEQMGEGWSDFFALMLTNKPGDNASVARGTGTYAANQPITGGGIRPAKYSPDFAINDYTYGDTNGLTYFNTQLNRQVPDVHSIGFIWATMLWDLNWKYVEKYGYASDVTANSTSGSARVLQLVTDALKLQGCNPTFIDGRDAIIAVDQAKYLGENRCMIWNVFAKRGLGINASAGSKSPTSFTNTAAVNAALNDQVQNFDVPADCLLSTSETGAVKNVGISIYPNPAKNEFYINFPSNTLGKVDVEIYDMSGKLISTENKISPESKKAISTSRLINGTYLVKVKGLGIDTTSKVIIAK